ncbi:hydrolase [Legionella yabuuchiae]|uniref:hydrolase n=1 Tax=Legionella yabuuchiae TaxID=376727 RepID=UPI0010560015|nr:hydrolase [Legionella yabuuchiae]
MLKSLQDLIGTTQANHKTMIHQLHQFCHINSGTENLNGLKEMHQTLMSAFTPLADEIESKVFPEIPLITMAGERIYKPCGKGLLIRKRPEKKRRVLLCGHMDTVYGVDHPFQSLTYIDDNRVNGPGVSDMKGGLIVILHALSGFEKTPFATDLGWDVFINADEEIGSPASAAYLEELSKDYQAALVYEPAMTESGTLAKNRKGSGKLTLIATGKAAHAGRSFYEGRNAICYLAEMLLDIHALNESKENFTINIGKISGGDALNIVPDKAVAKLDVRITHPDDEDLIRQKINSIIQKHQHKDYSLTLEGDFGRPVKRINPATERLFKRIQNIGSDLGLSIDWKDSGGCCDGNNLASHGLPVMDTLGVRGGNIHSSDEYILLDSLVERSCLSALLLVDLAQGGLEDLSKQ